MIFVTVGNATQGFGRLLKEVDRLAKSGFFGRQEVFMQIGHNDTFRPTATRCQPFLSMDEFQRHMTDASLILCHGGCTVFQALRLGKIPVVMPRCRRYGEHVNDHQVTFVKALAEEGRLVPAYEASDLEEAILEARRQKPPLWPKGKMQELVASAIRELIEGKSA